MITDYALRLSQEQSAAGMAGDVTQHVIDLLQARNIAMGEPLYAVITITTAFTTGATDSEIAWSFYQSISSAKTDSLYAHQLGASKSFTGDILGTAPRNLHKGAKITVALSPITVTNTDADDATSIANPDTPKGHRYIYGGFAVTGTQFTTGAFTIDICTQSMLGGSSVYSDMPIYPTGITIA